MNLAFSKRRVLALCALSVASLGCPAATAPPPIHAATYTQAAYMPFVAGQPFIVSITNSAYTSTSSSDYAEVQIPGSSRTYYWYPYPTTTTPLFTGQQVNGTTMTIVYNTAIKLVPPGGTWTGPLPPAPVIGPGTIVCIHTNLSGETCSTTTTPIKITPVTVNICPACP